MKDDDNKSDNSINLSDFTPEPTSSLLQILRKLAFTRDKWGEAIKSKISGLFS